MLKHHVPPLQQKSKGSISASVLYPALQKGCGLSAPQIWEKELLIPVNLEVEGCDLCALFPRTDI